MYRFKNGAAPKDATGAVQDPMAVGQLSIPEMTWRERILYRERKRFQLNRLSKQLEILLKEVSLAQAK
jgi:hypothetical protein